MKTYKIYTKRIANRLCKQGFRVVGNDINDQKPWLNVYLFEDTELLRDALAAIKEEINAEVNEDGRQ